jgi:hypothetical protein
VAYACNPGYSRGGEQEDGMLEASPEQIVLSQKNLSQKRAGGVAQGVGPQFKSQHWKKIKHIRKQKNIKNLNH